MVNSNGHKLDVLCFAFDVLDITVMSLTVILDCDVYCSVPALKSLMPETLSTLADVLDEVCFATFCFCFSYYPRRLCWSAWVGRSSPSVCLFVCLSAA